MVGSYFWITKSGENIASMQRGLDPVARLRGGMAFTASTMVARVRRRHRPGHEQHVDVVGERAPASKAIVCSIE